MLARRVALNAISDAFTRMERDDFPTSGFARLVTPYPLPPLPNGFPDLEGRDLQLAGSYREGGIRRASRRLIRESGEVSPYQPTPVLAMALAVSGVAVATVSPHAPKSARQLFGSPGDWFGDHSAMIMQLAIGALRVVGAAPAVRRLRRPLSACRRQPPALQPRPHPALRVANREGDSSLRSLSLSSSPAGATSGCRGCWGGASRLCAPRSTQRRSAYGSRLLSMEGKGVCICASV